ncbi:hypothetical protein AGMMS50225_09000 [Betaproteobacteria bacterium]|nr:hypothetical protein AGMMS50225_09000 [Betaproteobacteria bacterium]
MSKPLKITEAGAVQFPMVRHAAKIGWMTITPDEARARYAAYFYASGTGMSLVAGRTPPAADGKYNLNTGNIDSLPLPLPPTLDALDRKIALHRQKRAVLGDLFQSLLHKWMTGEIRVGDLDLSALSEQPANAGIRGR